MLVRSLPAALPVDRTLHAGRGRGKYNLFAGGNTNGGGSNSVSATVDAYSNTLAKSVAPQLTATRSQMGGADNTSYIFFGGGYGLSVPGNTGGSIFNYVDAYDNNLAKSMAQVLPTSVRYPRGGTTETYAVFAGGTTWIVGPPNTAPGVNQVVAYSTSKARTIATSLTVGRTQLGSARAGSWLLFAGGSDVSSSNNITFTVYSSVDAYSPTLGKTVAQTLSKARAYVKGGSSKTRAVFAGGTVNQAGDGFVPVVDTYTENLTRTVAPSLDKYPHRQASSLPDGGSLPVAALFSVIQDASRIDAYLDTGDYQYGD